MKNKRLFLVALLMLVGPVFAQADEQATAQKQELREAHEALREAAERVAELSRYASPTRSHVFKFLSDGDRAMLGVSIAPSTAVEKAGAQILGVSPGGPADEAGLQSGDILLAINGQRLDGTASNAAEKVLKVMSGLKPGDEVVLEYDRDGTLAETVVVAERRTPGLIAPIAPLPPLAPAAPLVEHRKIIINGDDVTDDIDFSVADLSGNGAAAFFIGGNQFYSGLELVNLSNPDLAGYFDNADGLLVVDVPDDFPADLRGGDILQSIDGRAPESSRKAFKILQSYETDETVTLSVFRDGDSMDLQLLIPEATKPAFSFGDLHSIPGLEALIDEENIEVWRSKAGELSGELEKVLHDKFINGFHFEFEDGEVHLDDQVNGEIEARTITIHKNESTI